MGGCSCRWLLRLTQSTKAKQVQSCRKLYIPVFTIFMWRIEFGPPRLDRGNGAAADKHLWGESPRQYQEYTFIG